MFSHVRLYLTGTLIWKWRWGGVLKESWWPPCSLLQHCREETWQWKAQELLSQSDCSLINTLSLRNTQEKQDVKSAPSLKWVRLVSKLAVEIKVNLKGFCCFYMFLNVCRSVRGVEYKNILPAWMDGNCPSKCVCHIPDDKWFLVCFLQMTRWWNTHGLLV